MLKPIQQKILKLLAINCRYTDTDVAKSIGVSADVIDYHIKQLIYNQKIGEFAAKFDYQLLGYRDYHYLLRVKDISAIPYTELEQIDQITFMNSSYGTHDLQLIIVAKDPEDLQAHMDKVNELLGDNIQHFYLSQANKVYKYTSILPPIDVEVKLPKNQKNFVYQLAQSNYWRRKNEPITLDATDKQLVKSLYADARSSYLELSKQIGVSNETIRYRLRRLIDSGFLMGFTINFGFYNFGYFTNYVLVKLRPYPDAELQAFFDSEKSVFYAARLHGDHSLIFYTLSKSAAEFGEVVDRFRIKFKNSILDTELLYFHNIYKYTQFPLNELEE